MGLSIALAQLNPTVGDVAGNPARVRRARDRAATSAPTSSSSPSWCWSATRRKTWCCGPRSSRPRPALRELERRERRAAARPGRDAAVARTTELHNAVALVADGRVELRFKHELPNYGVFDEKRVFAPGPLPEPVTFRGVRLGLPICEDIWFPDVRAHLARAGAELLLVPNGSPFEVEKFEQRLDLARARVRNRACRSPT